MKPKKFAMVTLVGMLVFAACGEKENPATADPPAGSVESVAEEGVQDTQTLTGNVETVSGTISVEQGVQHDDDTGRLCRQDHQHGRDIFHLL